MICNNTSKGVLNTLEFVLVETGQTSEQRVTIVLYCQKSIVNTVETQVNARLKLYGRRRSESGMEI